MTRLRLSTIFLLLLSAAALFAQSRRASTSPTATTLHVIAQQ